MKRLMILLLVVPLILTSCTREPYADFTASKKAVAVGELVYFTNRSMDAKSYEWDFGDGYASANYNVSHSWEAPGVYNVSLSAFGRNGHTDVYTMEIQVFGPVADFSVTSTTVKVGETVNFTNLSTGAQLYDWDFGDGGYSSDYDASYYWLDPGVYTVTLTASDNNGNYDVVSTTITVVAAAADLEIIVKEYYDEYVVPDASVILYPTLDDWDNQTNAIEEKFTDANGRVVFRGLTPGRVYYVDVYEQYHDNYQLAAEDVAWIETQVLQPDVLNSFFAYVDYYPPSKKTSATRKELKVIHGQMASGKEPRIKATSGKK